MHGDGYKVALSCENADEAKVEFNEPDSDPVFCDINQHDLQHDE